MINVSVTSLWYRLALYGTFFEPDLIMPNLCPFMRRAGLGLLIIAVLVYFCAIVLMVIGTPVVVISHTLLFGMEYWQTDNGYFVIGAFIWIIMFVIGILYAWFGTVVGEIAQTTIKTQYAKLDTGNWLLIAWMVAAHKRMCPSINFVAQPSTKDE